MKNFTKMILVSLVMIQTLGIAPQARSQGNATDIDLSGAITGLSGNLSAITHAPMASLFDNGPVFNSAGTGAAGANESIYYQGGTGSYGSGCQYVSGFYIADDFTVPPGRNWLVTSMDFFSYQANSGTTSTITGIYLRIWNGKPGIAGSTIIWGDMTTNRMGSTVFSNTYRVLTVNGGVARPIMTVVAETPGLSLYPGNYWVEWGCTGSLSSGPWAPPVVTAENATGNAILTTDGGSNYGDIYYNAYPQGMPFVINGDETIVSSVPGFQAGTSSAKVVVSPVFNDGLFNISIRNSLSETFTIRVYDNLGRIISGVMNVEVNGQADRTLDLRPLPAGLYSVILENGSNRVIRNILVNR
ncbi:MAG: T9SS type A sorting domain-containing protein [Bacteroidetes bacterium]|nr:T9SS type A sorting domain-containing protein [Bacteroidota bacterium]